MGIISLQPANGSFKNEIMGSPWPAASLLDSGCAIQSVTELDVFAGLISWKRWQQANASITKKMALMNLLGYRK